MECASLLQGVRVSRHTAPRPRGQSVVVCSTSNSNRPNAQTKAPDAKLWAGGNLEKNRRSPQGEVRGAGGCLGKHYPFCRQSSQPWVPGVCPVVMIWGIWMVINGCGHSLPHPKLVISLNLSALQPSGCVGGHSRQCL